MASEASVTDQPANEHVEEIKVADANEEVSASKLVHIETKDEEEQVKMKDKAKDETCITEPEEKLEPNECATVIEIQKDEGANDKSALEQSIEAEMKEKKNEKHVSDACEPSNGVDEEEKVKVEDTAKGETCTTKPEEKLEPNERATAIEEVQKDEATDDKSALEQSIEAEEKEIKNEKHVTDTCEPSNGVEEEDKVKVEDTAKGETCTTKPEEKLEPNECTTVIEEVQKDETTDDKSALEQSIEGEEKEIKNEKHATDTCEPSNGVFEEDKVKVEDTTKGETCTTEPEQKLETNEYATVIEEVQKDEAADNKSGLEQSIEAEDKEIKNEKHVTETCEPSKGVDEEEKIKVEDTAKGEICTTEQEKKQEPNDNATVIEEMQKDEAADDKSALEQSIEVEVKEIKNEKHVSDACEPSNVVEDQVRLDVPVVQESESDTVKVTEVSANVSEEVESVEQLPEESALPISISVTEDKAMETLTVSPINESVSDSMITPSICETLEVAPGENAIANGIKESPESRKEDPLLNDLSELVTEDSNDKLQQTVESESSVALDPPKVIDNEKSGVLLSEVLSTVEKADDDSNSNVTSKESKESIAAVGMVESADTTTISENAENVVEPEVKVPRVKEEDNVEVEKPTLITATQTISANEVAEDSEEAKYSGHVLVASEQNNEGLDSQKTNLVETSRDPDVAGVGNDIKSSAEQPQGEANDKEEELKPGAKQTLLDKLINEGKKEEVASKAEESLAENTRDIGNTKTGEEAPKKDIPAKTPQRHSNNIMSKLKQSIVKVKKAITGKSPSSKSMQSQGKDDTKPK